jgi:hypothetical protein
VTHRLLVAYLEELERMNAGYTIPTRIHAVLLVVEDELPIRMVIADVLAVGRERRPCIRQKRRHAAVFCA